MKSSKNAVEKREHIILLTNAFNEARKATEAYLKQYPDQWYPCGFAWVNIDGKSPIVKVLKENFGRLAGHKGHPKGWEVWNPSGDPTQCMDAKMAGAQAFARVLSAAGHKCYADCRMD